MVPPPDSVQRHFLPWNDALLPQAVRFLTVDWNGAGVLDLSSVLVIVPTSQSGRRLREALASHAAEKGQAVFSPRVLTPNALLAPTVDETLATRLESLLAWAEVFRELEMDEFREVFPVDPPARSFSWSMRLARDFARLQGVLVEGGLRLGDVTDRAGAFPEAARWAQIGALEKRYAGKLAELGLRDERAATLQTVEEAVVPEGIKRVVLLGTPDPLPLSLTVLARWAETVSTHVVIFAPESEKDTFDRWGRPIASSWEHRVLALPTFEEHVKLCTDPADQADRIVRLVKTYGDPEGIAAIGVSDGEVLPLLESGLRQAGLAVFNPEARTRSGDALFQLLSALATLAREGSFSALATLARCPDFLEFLSRELGEDFSAAEFLGDLDKLHMKRLPPSLAEARRHRPSRRELELAEQIHAQLNRGAFPENIQAVLGQIFAGRKFASAKAAEAELVSGAEAWASIMQEVGRAAARFEKVEPADWWEVALLLYGASPRLNDKPDHAVELNGWLELLWEDAPHLAIAGLNDGLVPEAIVGDAFLPEALRVALGLKTNAERFARDAYFLQALAASRAKAGQLDLLCGKTSVAGDPLRPSRLLLRCEDQELPERVRFLFREIETNRKSPAWRRAWKLLPRREPPPASVAVTGLRAWLDCPFRFYLSYVLRMEAIDPVKTELDAMDFGTLCHAALEAMGRDEVMRDCTDPAELRRFLLSRLESTANERFGRHLTLPLVVQLESARQRLSRVADVQAELRAEGWRIEHVELPFELEVSGLTVRGKIDRIDRHVTSGAVRVLDYKTSDSAVTPASAHLRSAKRNGENAPEFARVMIGGKEHVWRDLQLPLYQRWLAGKERGEISCGYFNLPKAATETSFLTWEEFPPELAESAWRCASGVAEKIRAGIFWPPNEEKAERDDDFASLFHHGVADSVQWEEAK